MSNKKSRDVGRQVEKQARAAKAAGKGQAKRSRGGELDSRESKSFSWGASPSS